MVPPEDGGRPRAFEGGEEARAAGGGQRLRAAYFPPRPPREKKGGRFASRNKISVLRRPSLRYGRAGFAGAVQPPPAPPATSLAIKAARGGSPLKEDRP